MLVTVDSKPTRLSDQSIITLGPCLSEYLMDAVQVIILSQIFLSTENYYAFIYSFHMSHLIVLDAPDHV
jgi:pre-rRNA-processing protein IPI1